MFESRLWHSSARSANYSRITALKWAVHIPFTTQKEKWTGHTMWKINRSIFFPSFLPSSSFFTFSFSLHDFREILWGDFRISLEKMRTLVNAWILNIERFQEQILSKRKHLMRHHNNISSSRTNREGKFLHTCLLLIDLCGKCRKSCDFALCVN